MQFTTFVAVDAEHDRELRVSCETWRRFKPEIWQNPLVIISDGVQDLSYLEHQQLTILSPLSQPFTSQREKMLTSLTILPATTCQTDWYLKIDTDTVATSTGRWIDERWFKDGACLVASPWSYTKPGSFLTALDAWADNVPAMHAVPAPDRVHDGDRAYSKRIISYVMFGHTGWTNRVVSWLDGERLPCPSQDTFLWYCAERSRSLVRRVAMKNYGWVHCGSNLRRVRLASGITD